MTTQTNIHVTTRSMILGVLWGMLVLSLLCSQSIRYGHADSPIAASADQIKPLATGASAPRFVVQTVDGENFVFEPRDLDNPAIIITFRGGWCPYCNMHLSELRHVIPEIREMGVDVLFLSGDRSELLFDSLKAETQQQIEDLDYAIYSDADAYAAVALGIAFRASDYTINRRKEKGQDIAGSSMLNHGVLPVPAVFAIARDGVIAFAYANPDYKIRVPADELLAVAKTISVR